MHKTSAKFNDVNHNVTTTRRDKLSRRIRMQGFAPLTNPLVHRVFLRFICMQRARSRTQAYTRQHIRHRIVELSLAILEREPIDKLLSLWSSS